jgi:hypothetical protein
VRRYGFTAKLKISVLSNFEYLVIYDTSVKVDGDDTFNKARIKNTITQNMKLTLMKFVTY